jgi:Protein of unknown function (DUF 659)
MFNHLVECQQYLDYCSAHNIHNKVTRKANAPGKSKPQLPFPTLTPSEKEDLDRQAARVCLIGGYPFSIFEDEEMKAFCKGMNAAYKPPSRQKIAGELLDSQYVDIKRDIDAFLNRQNWLNIVTDESTNINHSRVCNISIHTSVGTLHYISEDIGAQKMNAIGYAAWLTKHLLKITDNDTLRINSISADTCSTMFSMRDLLQQTQPFKHVFFIPCESHSLQLLVKDLLSIPRLKDIHTKAQAVVKAFRKSPLQYAHLREIQMDCYKTHYALVLSVITHWGIQFRLISSLLRSKAALRKYIDDHESKDLGYNAYEYIADRNFWRDLDIMRELLEPIDEHLKMSESGRGHLGLVLHRWIDILKHLKRRIKDIPELEDFINENDGIFAKRYKRQVASIHIVAFYLRPDNRSISMTPEHEMVIYKFSKQYTKCEEDAHMFWAEFQAFRSQMAPFSADRPCWIISDDVRLFWSNMNTHTRIIGNLALRIFSTPTNSVASEQAFSVQNHVQCKLRASLLNSKVNKLTYTYINGRMLWKIGSVAENKVVEARISPQNLTPEEEVQLENELLAEENFLDDDMQSESEEEESWLEDDED